MGAQMMFPTAAWRGGNDLLAMPVWSLLEAAAGGVNTPPFHIFEENV
jgi:hypothetical protein